ncbi:MAG: alpha-amylase family glycosyl hydrolase, partial [Pseudomonadota bacterium]
MTPPIVATYRLQLRNGFGFEQARALLPYLKRLGISHLYLSPIFKARHGSTHGYDCVDPREIDPVLGGAAGFAELSAELAAQGMGLLLDIVPNHLGVGPENPFWQAMLRDGPRSEAAAFFDVDWEAIAGGVPGKILLPFLGRPLEEVIAAGELEQVDDPAPAIRYHQHIFPLAPGTETGTLEDVLAKQHWRLAWWRCG